MFVGDLPSEHGVHTYHRSFDETPAEAVFHTRLLHESVGVSANVYAGPAYGFDDYFERFVDVRPNRRYPAGATPAEFDSPGAFARRALRGPNRSVLNGLTGVLHERWRDLPGPKLVDDTGAAVARDEWAEIGRDVVPAELLGMSAGPEPPADFDRDYYERAIRAAYRSDTTVVWDSLGAAREYTVGATPSDQTLVAEDVDVPEWATDAFPTDLNRASATARSNRATDDDDEVSDAVAARLDELGYV